MKITFLAPYPKGKSPSQRFRFEQYMSILQEKGIITDFFSFWSINGWDKLYLRGHRWSKALALISGFVRRFLVLFRLVSSDFIFIHRECTPVGPPFFEWFIAKIHKKKIIFDFDDAIWLPNTSEENSIVAFAKWHSKTKSVCTWSHRISCGNEFLADYAAQFNKNVSLNPTTIDTVNFHNASLHQIAKNSSITTIGWTGTHSTLPYLQFLEPVINELGKNYPIRFLVISNKPPTLNIEKLEFVKWSQETEIQDLLQFDIGVMPLNDEEWAKGKCGFKALQYMALGIPTIASPVGVNSKIIEHGVNGFLCSTKDEWVKTLVNLIEDTDLRQSIGDKGIQKIQEHYSVDSNTENFLRLFR